MVEETTTNTRITLNRVWSSVLTQPRLSALTLPLLLVALAFMVYWFVGPRETPYMHYVNQANAFLHGRVDLDPEYARNLHLLERAMDREQLRLVEQGITPPPCGQVKCYMTHPPLPALLMIPLVAVKGLDVNQTLVSVVLGAITAFLVYRVTRSLVTSVPSQVWLTVLFMFGTIFWYVAADGGVWFTSHTAAVLFLFAAIYTALVPRSALWAGFFLGAAFLSRQTTAAALPFFIIMFAPQWLKPAAPGQPLWKRIDLAPGMQFAAAAIPFVLFSFLFNYLRFDDPLEGGYEHTEQLYQPHLQHVYNHGSFHYTYITRHFTAALEAMPILQTSAPYILPSWSAQAIWATTPAFFYAFFATLRERWMVLAGIGAILIMVGVVVSRWIVGLWDGGWATYDPPHFIHLWPFFGLIGLAVGASVGAALRAIRDSTWRADGGRALLPLACWAAILPVALAIFLFAATGWAQFGYRYALDFYPFLFLLVVLAVGNSIRWHHKALIIASIIIIAWGVFWIFQFERGAGPFPSNFLDLQWVRF